MSRVHAIGELRLTGVRCCCPACGQGFNSVSLFDRHRVGRYSQDGTGRRCLTADEMQARGWETNAAGFWTRARYRVSAGTGRPGKAISDSAYQTSPQNSRRVQRAGAIG